MTMSRVHSKSGGAGFVVVAAFTLLGLAVGAFMMYVGWQHNSQGEFYDETGIHWGYWLFIGFSWFAFITVVPYAIAIGHFRFGDVLVGRVVRMQRQRSNHAMERTADRCALHF